MDDLPPDGGPSNKRSKRRPDIGSGAGCLEVLNHPLERIVNSEQVFCETGPFGFSVSRCIIRALRTFLIPAQHVINVLIDCCELICMGLPGRMSLRNSAKVPLPHLIVLLI